MKNLKYIIHLFFCFELLFAGCDNNARNQNIRNGHDTTQNDNVQEPSLNMHVLDQSTFSPYREIDSLVRLLDKRFAFSGVRKLDSICNGGDGDLTEYLGSITISLFENHLNDFIEYLQINPRSCLKARIIEALGAEYSVYEKTGRPEKLLEEENRLISIAKEQKLDDRKIEFIKEIFSKVNPNILD